MIRRDSVKTDPEQTSKQTSAESVAKKEVIPISTNQKGWFAVVPGTFSDKAARMVCKKKYDM